jgi:hypothetical protein
MYGQLNLRTLETVHAAVGKSKGLTSGSLYESRRGFLDLQAYFPGIFGADRCAIGEAMNAGPKHEKISDWIVRNGLDSDTVWTIITINDQFVGSKAERREHMLWWLEREINAHKDAALMEALPVTYSAEDARELAAA